jgi:hypothetical protein
MTDLDLFAMGCGVMFIVLAGSYAYLRERFLEGTRRAKVKIELERRLRAQARKATRPSA